MRSLPDGSGVANSLRSSRLRGGIGGRSSPLSDGRVRRLCTSRLSSSRFEARASFFWIRASCCRNCRLSAAAAARALAILTEILCSSSFKARSRSNCSCSCRRAFSRATSEAAKRPLSTMRRLLVDGACAGAELGRSSLAALRRRRGGSFGSGDRRTNVFCWSTWLLRRRLFWCRAKDAVDIA